MEWLSLIRCPTCSGPIRHDGEGMFRCSGCNANYPAAGSVPDFIAREGDTAAPGIELDYDYHLRRRSRLPARFIQPVLPVVGTSIDQA